LQIPILCNASVGAIAGAAATDGSRGAALCHASALPKASGCDSQPGSQLSATGARLCVAQL